MLARRLCSVSRRLVSTSKPCVYAPRSTIHVLSKYTTPLTLSRCTFTTTSTAAPPNFEKEQKEEEQTGAEEAIDENVMLQRTISELALTKYVPIHGWSEESLYKAIEELGYSNALIGLFPNGPSDLVHYFIDSNNAKVIQALDELTQKESLRPSELIRRAIEMRLRLNIPYIRILPEALAHSARPSVFVDSCQRLGWLVDDIWHLAGDKSTDINWYTKRFSLGGVYLATELYMIDDKSHDYANTWKFLDQLLAEVKTLGSCFSGSSATSPGDRMATFGNLLNATFQGVSTILSNFNSATASASTSTPPPPVFTTLKTAAEDIGKNVFQNNPLGANLKSTVENVVANSPLSQNVRTTIENIATQASAHPIGQQIKQAVDQTPLAGVIEQTQARLSQKPGFQPEQVAEVVSTTLDQMGRAINAATQLNEKVVITQVEIKQTLVDPETQNSIRHETVTVEDTTVITDNNTKTEDATKKN